MMKIDRVLMMMLVLLAIGVGVLAAERRVKLDELARCQAQLQQQ